MGVVVVFHAVENMWKTANSKWEKTELNSNSASTLQRQHAKCDEQCHNTHLTFHHFCPRLIFSFSSFSKQISWHTIHTMEKALEFSAHGCHLHCLHAISITSRYCNKKQILRHGALKQISCIYIHRVHKEWKCAENYNKRHNRMLS